MLTENVQRATAPTRTRMHTTSPPARRSGPATLASSLTTPSLSAREAIIPLPRRLLLHTLASPSSLDVQHLVGLVTRNRTLKL